MTSNVPESQLKAPESRNRVFFYAVFFAVVVAGTVIYFGAASMNKRAGQTGSNVDPKSTYQARCAGCHQDDGNGLPDQVPPLAGSENVLGDPAVAANIVLHGIQGPVTVHGKKFNALMPGLKDVMNDDEIAAALTYARTSWGNAASAVDAATVAKARSANAARNAPWTADELKH
jgi:mono/diheme cytochrome c family protein